MSGVRVDHQFKSLPPSWHGLELRDAARLRTPLFGPEAASPIMVLRNQALDHNLRLMADYARAGRVLMAPHGKTTMAPRLVQRQLDLGAWAVTAANAGQARVFVDHGAPRVLIANEVVDAAGLRWLAETAAAGKTQLLCYVDSVAGVRLLENALAGAGAAHPLDVLLEIGFRGGRAGCRDVDTAIEVAAAVDGSHRLRLAGTAGYEGIIAHDRRPESLDAVRRFLRTMREFTQRLFDRGYLTGPEPIVVSAGGSGYFDLVVEELRDDWPADAPVQLLIRPGAYVSHDSLFYVELSPFSGAADPERRFKPALELWTQVLSRPEPGLAILNAGKRDAPVTEGMPLPFAARSGEAALDVAGLRVADMNDQHTYLHLPADHPLGVADWVGLGISHPCLAFDRWQVLPVVDETDSVVDVVRTYF